MVPGGWVVLLVLRVGWVVVLVLRVGWAGVLWVGRVGVWVVLFGGVVWVVVVLRAVWVGWVVVWVVCVGGVGWAGPVVVVVALLVVVTVVVWLKFAEIWRAPPPNLPRVYVWVDSGVGFDIT